MLETQRALLELFYSAMPVVIVAYLTGEPRQVEVVLDEVLLNLTEKLVSPQAAKPGYPRRDSLLATACFFAAATLSIGVEVFFGLEGRRHSKAKTAKVP